MKTLKQLLGIKTFYAIPGDNGIDITKGKKYELKYLDKKSGFIKDDANCKIYIVFNNDKHINSNWEIITE
jgi:hypothetical protein